VVVYHPEAPKRSGKIPEKDLVPWVLLATFNGGFKATHGQFGAMSEGITVLQPRPLLGTLVVHNDGRIEIGEWGDEIDPEVKCISWRQNGPLVIHKGKVNSNIYNNDPTDWGYTVDDVSPTWRSGIGLSLDGSTLFYYAGPKLTMEALAEGMVASGASEGLQLDINNYWVHFTAIRTDNEKLIAEPLVPDAMKENIDRYLFPYTRDYFYVTDANSNR